MTTINPNLVNGARGSENKSMPNALSDDFLKNYYPIEVTTKTIVSKKGDDYTKVFIVCQRYDYTIPISEYNTNKRLVNCGGNPANRIEIELPLELYSPLFATSAGYQRLFSAKEKGEYLEMISKLQSDVQDGIKAAFIQLNSLKEGAVNIARNMGLSTNSLDENSWYKHKIIRGEESGNRFEEAISTKINEMRESVSVYSMIKNGKLPVGSVIREYSNVYNGVTYKSFRLSVPFN